MELDCCFLVLFSFLRINGAQIHADQVIRYIALVLASGSQIPAPRPNFLSFSLVSKPTRGARWPDASFLSRPGTTHASLFGASCEPFLR